jgi:hypothetical protein
MNDEPSIPWYKSRILQGILTIVVTQLIAKITGMWHIDFAVLGLDVNSIVEWLMNIISAAAVAYATHARATKPIPPITLTQTGADKANLTAPPFSPKETSTP